MAPSAIGPGVVIRVASAADQPAIRRIVRDANINPFSLDWRRFLVAERDGRIIGVGQVKPHGDGSRELASIAVLPDWRGRGIASAVIQALLARESGPLYLTCRSPLESFYLRFGFQRIERDEMSPYFRRISWVANPPRFVARLFGQSEIWILIMKRYATPVSASPGAQ
jgi:N-acetylglutamate synthase-like GNAT family acetyltransferase